MTISAPSASPEQGIAFFHDHVLADLRRVDGFREVWLLKACGDGEALAISVWDTEEQLYAAQRTSRALHAERYRPQGSGERHDARVYEVAFHAQSVLD